ncbi:hypothetical protein [Variovorax sp. 22077]|uniref:hypothetical protein n=1 Tax=Variovorax sp. 22077 TaxID=3453867 RepID=UPI003F869400
MAEKNTRRRSILYSSLETINKTISCRSSECCSPIDLWDRAAPAHRGTNKWLLVTRLLDARRPWNAPKQDDPACGLVAAGTELDGAVGSDSAGRHTAWLCRMANSLAMGCRVPVPRKRATGKARNRCGERGGVGVARPVEQFVRGAFVDDASFAHHQHAIASEAVRRESRLSCGSWNTICTRLRQGAHAAPHRIAPHHTTPHHTVMRCRPKNKNGSAYADSALRFSGPRLNNAVSCLRGECLLVVSEATFNGPCGARFFLR